MLLLALAVSAFVPGIHLDVRSPSGQSMVETATTLVAALAAALLFGRFWRHAGLRDLLIGCGLATVATSNLATYVLFANHVHPLGASPAWVALGGCLLGWTPIAWAAQLRDRPVLRNRPEAIRVGVANAGMVAGLATLAIALSAGVAASASMGRGSLANPAAAVIVQLLTALIAGAAALGFARQGGRNPDLTQRLTLLAAALAVGASLAYCATPSLYESRIGNGDILRIGSLLALLFYAAVELLLDERRAISRGIAHERRRMAADVHDLIMQDLSFALANARVIADNPGSASQADTVVEAGERALAGARDVLSGLTRQDSKPVVEAVEAGVRAAARNAKLTFNADSVGAYEQPDELTRDALLHISREAVTNATKHARSKTAIEVTLEYEDDWRLTIRDEGRGFDVDEGLDGEAGFGLRSMHERAAALGGSLQVMSAPGRGTTVSAVLP
ncbi:MAG TPA: ATP-binding protein [Solirubrobacteraceae bacterium]|nr:ATP-binding protein [Solirubrobacteraceae bacterium]